MTETIKGIIFKLLDSSLVPENNIDLFSGKLSVSLAYIYYGSSQGSELVYDKGLAFLTEVLKSVEYSKYINQERELPLIGYVIGHLNQHDFVEIDTGSVLAEADAFILDKVFLTDLDSANIYQFLINGYFIASRLINQKFNSKLFDISLLNSMLVEIIRYIETLRIPLVERPLRGKVEVTENLIASLINILNFSRYLERYSLCLELVNALKQKIHNFQFKHNQVDQVDLYHKFLFYNYLQPPNHALALKNEWLQFPFDLTFLLDCEKGKLGVSQALTLCYLKKFDALHARQMSRPFNENILSDLIKYHGLSGNPDHYHHRRNGVGLINGLTSILFLDLDSIDHFFWEIVILMPLYNLKPLSSI